MRTSTRWYGGDALFKSSFTPIPVINSFGKLSGSTLCFWTAPPPKICACLVATIYQRLLRLMTRRHGWKRTEPHLELIFKVAALYCANHDDSMIDRFLGMSRKRNYHGPVERYIYYRFCNSGDNVRFVYNQLHSCNLWLTFRKGTCPRRDKPAHGCYRPDRDLYKQIWSDRSSLQRAYQEVVKTWLVAPSRSFDDERIESAPDYSDAEDNLSVLSEDLEEDFDYGEVDKWSWD